MKQITLQQIADLVEGELHGDPETIVTNADIIRDAKVGYITFAEKEEYLGRLRECMATAVLIPEKLVSEYVSGETKEFVSVLNATTAFTKIVEFFRPPLLAPKPFVDESAHVHETATIGEGVVIEQGVIVGANVSIGKGTRIHAGVRIMAGTSIGEETVVFPGAVIYENCVIGSQCLIHANSVIGCYGFGYNSTGSSHDICAQLGNVVIDDNVDIGAGTTIDRATFGSTQIGEGTKIDNQVQIGHNCKIGKRNLICALVGIAGSSSTGDDVVMAGQVGIGDHVHIGNMVVLGAKSGVMSDIPDKQVYVGIPATPAKQQMLIVAATHRLPEMRKKLNRMDKKLDSIASQDSSDVSEVEPNAA